MYACKDGDEAAKIEMEMAAARPVHYVANPIVCQEDVNQANSSDVLRDSVLDINPTTDHDLFLQNGIMFGAAGRTEHSTFAPDLADVDSLCLSPQRAAARIAGRNQTDYPVHRCKFHSHPQLAMTVLEFDTSEIPTCITCLK